MKIVVTVDVEEEGLFTGDFPRTPKGLDNVPRLAKIKGLLQKYGLPPTLLVDYPVITDDLCTSFLAEFKESTRAEIGAHLHPWNTPPYKNQGEPTTSESIPTQVLQRKLENLVSAIEKKTGSSPKSFRMGRWDFSQNVEELLPLVGIRVDSSVAPLQATPAGTRFFDASADPFWLSKGETSLLEVPITTVPLARWTVPAMSQLCHRYGRKPARAFSKLGRVGIQPVWFSEFSMRLAARLHHQRGGDVLVMFFHSSELMPGGSPHFPDEASVESFIAKIDRFFNWMKGWTTLEGCRLSDLLDYMEDER